MTRMVTRSGRWVALAVALTLLTAQPATAIVWAEPAAVSDSGHGTTSINSTAVTRLKSVHVVYTESTDGLSVAMHRRSPDGGVSWGTPIQISRPEAHTVYGAAMDASWDTILDVVIGEEDVSGNRVVWYHRSENGGADWEAPVQLTAADGEAGVADVVRFRDRVMVVYTDAQSGGVYVRRSRNGGVSFGGSVFVGHTTNEPDPARAGSREGYPAIDYEDGRLHVAWQANDHTLNAKRAGNDTLAFGSATVLSRSSTGGRVSLTVESASVYVGFTSIVEGQPHATLRWARRDGSIWKGTQLVGGPNTFDPSLEGDSYNIRAAYTKCTVADCSHQAAVVRTADKGLQLTWWKAIRVSRTIDGPRAVAVGVPSVYFKKFAAFYVRVTASGRTFIYSRARL